MSVNYVREDWCDASLDNLQKISGDIMISGKLTVSLKSSGNRQKLRIRTYLSLHLKLDDSQRQYYEKIYYLPVFVHPWLLIINGRLRLGQVMMENRENPSLDVQDVFRFIVCAVNLSNFPFFVFKLDWTLK